VVDGPCNMGTAGGTVRGIQTCQNRGGGVELKVEPCQPTWRQHTSATTTSTGKPTPGSSLERISGSRWPSNYDPGASDRPQVSLFWLVRNGTFSLFLPGWPGATLSCTRRPRVTLTAARRPTATLAAARRPRATLASTDRPAAGDPDHRPPSNSDPGRRPPPKSDPVLDGHQPATLPPGDLRDGLQSTLLRPRRNTPL
jgi:hypothetical protein